MGVKKYGTYTNDNRTGDEIDTSVNANNLGSVVESTVEAGIYHLDARKSKYNDIEIGGVDGRHYWLLQRMSNTVDLLGVKQNINIIPGLNVTVNGLDVEKSNTGNSWNASFYSGQSFNPMIENFAVSWLIETVTGTVREMGGLDGDPAQNNSYTSMEYAVYQVNNYFNTSVYESGAAVAIPSSSRFILQVGDRIGLKCVNNNISYFVLRNGVETIIYTSLKKATSLLYFKGAFNRGSTSSGHSSIGSVVWHTSKKVVNTLIELSGNSADTLSAEHVELGNKIGINLDANSKYSDLIYTPVVDARYADDAGDLYPVGVTHGFFAGAAQSILSIEI